MDLHRVSTESNLCLRIASLSHFRNIDAVKFLEHSWKLATSNVDKLYIYKAFSEHPFRNMLIIFACMLWHHTC